MAATEHAVETGAGGSTESQWLTYVRGDNAIVNGSLGGLDASVVGTVTPTTTQTNSATNSYTLSATQHYVTDAAGLRSGSDTYSLQATDHTEAGSRVLGAGTLTFDPSSTASVSSTQASTFDASSTHTSSYTWSDSLPTGKDVHWSSRTGTETAAAMTSVWYAASGTGWWSAEAGSATSTVSDAVSGTESVSASYFVTPSGSATAVPTPTSTVASYSYREAHGTGLRSATLSYSGTATATTVNAVPATYSGGLDYADGFRSSVTDTHDYTVSVAPSPGERRWTTQLATASQTASMAGTYWDDYADTTSTASGSTATRSTSLDLATTSARDTATLVVAAGGGYTSLNGYSVSYLTNTTALTGTNTYSVSYDGWHTAAQNSTDWFATDAFRASDSATQAVASTGTFTPAGGTETRLSTGGDTHTVGSADALLWGSSWWKASSSTSTHASAESATYSTTFSAARHTVTVTRAETASQSAWWDAGTDSDDSAGTETSTTTAADAYDQAVAVTGGDPNVVTVTAEDRSGWRVNRHEKANALSADRESSTLTTSSHQDQTVSTTAAGAKDTRITAAHAESLTVTATGDLFGVRTWSMTSTDTRQSSATVLARDGATVGLTGTTVSYSGYDSTWRHRHTLSTRDEDGHVDPVTGWVLWTYTESVSDDTAVGGIPWDSENAFCAAVSAFLTEVLTAALFAVGIAAISAVLPAAGWTIGAYLLTQLPGIYDSVRDQAYAALTGRHPQTGQELTAAEWGEAVGGLVGVFVGLYVGAKLAHGIGESGRGSPKAERVAGERPAAREPGLMERPSDRKANLAAEKGRPAAGAGPESAPKAPPRVHGRVGRVLRRRHPAL